MIILSDRITKFILVNQILTISSNLMVKIIFNRVKIQDTIIVTAILTTEINTTHIKIKILISIIIEFIHLTI